jgi:hypothetical protein
VRKFISILLMCLFGVLVAPMAGAGLPMAGASMDMNHVACPDCDAEADDGHDLCPHALICFLYLDLPLFVTDGERPLQPQIREMTEPWSAGSLSQGADPQPPRMLAGIF